MFLFISHKDFPQELVCVQVRIQHFLMVLFWNMCTCVHMHVCAHEHADYRQLRKRQKEGMRGCDEGKNWGGVFSGLIQSNSLCTPHIYSQGLVHLLWTWFHHL